MEYLLAGLIGALTTVAIEAARLVRETRLRRSGDKRTRDEDESEG